MRCSLIERKRLSGQFERMEEKRGARYSITLVGSYLASLEFRSN